jgi:hypothetical protein
MFRRSTSRSRVLRRRRRLLLPHNASPVISALHRVGVRPPIMIVPYLLRHKLDWIWTCLFTCEAAVGLPVLLHKWLLDGAGTSIGSCADSCSPRSGSVSCYPTSRSVFSSDSLPAILPFALYIPHSVRHRHLRRNNIHRRPSIKVVMRRRHLPI